MSSNLAIKLRSGTQQAHTSAENVGFMKCFLKGVVDRDCFAKFLSNLYYVYSELVVCQANFARLNLDINAPFFGEHLWFENPNRH